MVMPEQLKVSEVLSRLSSEIVEKLRGLSEVAVFEGEDQVMSSIGHLEASRLIWVERGGNTIDVSVSVESDRAVGNVASIRVSQQADYRFGSPKAVLEWATFLGEVATVAEAVRTGNDLQ